MPTNCYGYITTALTIYYIVLAHKTSLYYPSSISPLSHSSWGQATTESGVTCTVDPHPHMPTYDHVSHLKTRKADARAHARW